MRARATTIATRTTRATTRATTTTTTKGKKQLLDSRMREANYTHVSQLIIEHLLIAYYRDINYDLKSSQINYRFKTSLYNSRLQDKQID
jgi:hypothetical protein